MKQLQIFQNAPDKTTEFLAGKAGEGKDVTRFNLYEDADYDKLWALVQEHEDIITWW